MVMSVQHKVCAVRGDYTFQYMGVEQALVLRRLGDGRMMDQYDPKDIFRGEFVERGGKFGQLFCAQPSGRQEGRGWHTGREADQRDVVAPTDKGKAPDSLVVAHVGAPLARCEDRRLKYISVVVARHERYVLAGAYVLKPVAPLREFRCKTDIGDIAGDRDVVGCLRLQVGDDCGKGRRIMDEAPLLLPINVAGDAHADQLAPARRRKGGEMGIGKMREGEHCVCHARLVRGMTVIETSQKVAL